MKKRVFCFMMIASMMAMILAGCSKSAESGNSEVSKNDTTENKDNSNNSKKEDNTEKNTAEQKEVSISFYTTETGKDDMFLSLIDDFEKKNPGIQVEYIAAGDDQLQKWMALYASNQGPTVSFMDPINIYENQDRMRSYTQEECPWLSNIEENALGCFTYNGKIYGIPGSAAGFGLLYNQRVLDEAVGGTFDPATIKTRQDLKELFDKIEATGAAASMFTGVNWSLGAHYLGLVYGAYRGDVATREAFVASEKNGEVKLIEDKVFNQLMDTFDLIAEYNYNKQDPLVGNVNIDAEALATGKVGTWFMGDWAWTYLGVIEEKDSQYGILPIPVSDDEDDYLNTIIPTSYAKGYCIDASQNSEENQQAGLKFVEYLSSDEYALELLAKVCGQAFPYKNFAAEIESPLGMATAKYIAEGKIYDFYGTANMMPSDFWYENGAYMCEYLAGASNRETLAGNIENYWERQE